MYQLCIVSLQDKYLDCGMTAGKFPQFSKDISKINSICCSRFQTGDFDFLLSPGLIPEGITKKETEDSLICQCKFSIFCYFDRE